MSSELPRKHGSPPPFPLCTFPWVSLAGNSHVCLRCPGPMPMPRFLKSLGLPGKVRLLPLLPSHCALSSLLLWPGHHADCHCFRVYFSQTWSPQDCVLLTGRKCAGLIPVFLASGPGACTEHTLETVSLFSVFCEHISVTQQTLAQFHRLTSLGVKGDSEQPSRVRRSGLDCPHQPQLVLDWECHSPGLCNKNPFSQFLKQVFS